MKDTSLRSELAMFARRLKGVFARRGLTSAQRWCWMSGGMAASAEPRQTDLPLEEARAILEMHVRTTRWGWRDLARRLEIVSFEQTGAFDVVFQSFTESRNVVATYEPYVNAFIDGPDQGRPPLPWEIPQPLPPMFTREERRVVRIPHTDEVRVCHVCQGNGLITCGKCSGGGRVTCSRCHGRGSTTEWRTVTETDSQGNTTSRSESYSERCFSCRGSGRVTCSKCGGNGKVICTSCNGHRRLCHFRQLHIVYLTHTNSRQIEDTELPDELIADAHGIAILTEEDAQIEPGGTSEGGAGPYRGANLRVNARVAAAANKLIARHKFDPEEKLHRQRLVVRAVPVWEARYRWRKEERVFWIYGTDHLVHAPKYPLSPWRVGMATVGGASIPASIVAAITLSNAPELEPELSPPPAHVAATSPARYDPEPARIPRAPRGHKEPATQGALTALRGHKSVLLHSNPPGLKVYNDGIFLGITPLSVTIETYTKNAPACSTGHCSEGRCVGGKCEPTTKFTVRGAGTTRIYELGASDGDVVDVR